ncbi:Wzz/FepE/Etk N-terminal domain-containing protein [Pseudonocardia hispaniensis]|uniref:Wzz/FepE/Etk N-terminal domain-containing protein n=1 Tax=Pseudonocardia hispaniensis TaxID=904933 RepID=A0ABW1J8D2_9PSEU
MTTTTTTATSTPEPLLDLQRLVAGIRWRRRLWAGCAVAGLLLGVLFTVALPSRVTAQARVYVVHESEEVGDPSVLMDTDVAVFETSRIAAAAMQRLGTTEPIQDFRDSYSGAAVAPNVLGITVRAADKAQALAKASALADSFIADHVQRIEDRAKAQVAALTEQAARAERELAELDAGIAAADRAGDAGQVAALGARRGAMSGQIEDVTQRAALAGIGSPQVAAGTQILDAPHVTSRSLPVSAGLAGIVGLVLGLGVGLALAAVATVVRDRPVLRRDIADHLGASVLVQLSAPTRRRLWRRRSRAEVERGRVAATLARLVRDSPAGVSLLELGCPQVAVPLAIDVATLLVLEQPVLVVDDLPGRPVVEYAATSENPVAVRDGADYPADRPERGTSGRFVLGVGTVGFGATWTDLPRLGRETLLVVRAGYAATEWLHTVARQLADAEIVIIGVVLVHPDPRDRSDGTLWDGLHMALRGRAAPGPGGTAAADPSRTQGTTVEASPRGEPAPAVTAAPVIDLELR